MNQILDNYVNHTITRNEIKPENSQNKENSQ